MCPIETIEPDGFAVALRALAWVLGEPDRASRFLALTGLDPDDLRRRAGEASVLVATLCYLENHEPDLIVCAATLETRPEALISARLLLEAA
jgi:hypothetical protein